MKTLAQALSPNNWPDVIIGRRPDEKPRHAVTVHEWDNRPDELADASAYLFDPEADRMGLECWFEIDQVDRPVHPQNAYHVWINGRCCLAPGFIRIYVSEKHFNVMRPMLDRPAAVPAAMIANARAEDIEHAVKRMQNLGVLIPPQALTREPDYRNLLLKYMQHVIDEVGVTYTVRLPQTMGGKDTVYFTAKERDELRALAHEATQLANR